MSASRPSSAQAQPWYRQRIWRQWPAPVRSVVPRCRPTLAKARAAPRPPRAPRDGRAPAAIDALGLDGRRLAVMGENWAGTIVAHLGALAAGVSSVPVPRYLGVDEVAYILADSAAGALLCSGATADVAARAAARTG